MTKYATVTEKGQITLPAEMRRALNLAPEKKLNITLEGKRIYISKPADIEETRRLLQSEMARKGTTRTRVKSGDGWTSHVKEKYGAES
jgi:AbrB family looped-hinge helix DNA binding protein